MTAANAELGGIDRAHSAAPPVPGLPRPAWPPFHEDLLFHPHFDAILCGSFGAGTVAVSAFMFLHGAVAAAAAAVGLLAAYKLGSVYVEKVWANAERREMESCRKLGYRPHPRKPPPWPARRGIDRHLARMRENGWAR